MQELFPTKQTAGKHHELPWDQTRWAALWVRTVSSWPALKFLQIHPPQLERPLEDVEHSFNSCLGWILTFSDKESAPKKPWELVSSLPWTPLAAEPKVRKCYPVCSALTLHSHRQGWAFCDLVPAPFYCCTAFKKPKTQQFLAKVRAVQVLSPHEENARIFAGKIQAVSISDSSL